MSWVCRGPVAARGGMRMLRGWQRQVVGAVCGRPLTGACRIRSLLRGRWQQAHFWGGEGWGGGVEMGGKAGSSLWARLAAAWRLPDSLTSEGLWPHSAAPPALG